MAFIKPMLSYKPNTSYLLTHQPMQLNSSPTGQNGRYFGRQHFQIIFLNENDKIQI